MNRRPAHHRRVARGALLLSMIVAMAVVVPLGSLISPAMAADAAEPVVEQAAGPGALLGIWMALGLVAVLGGLFAARRSRSAVAR